MMTGCKRDYIIKVANNLVDAQEQRHTLREWLAEHARSEPVHYKKIAEALQRDPASVSASFSIEGKQALENNRPAYFVRVGSGLYQYNNLCENAVDEELIKEVLDRVDDFNKSTRREMRYNIAQLDIKGFEELAKIILFNVRVRVEEAEVIRRSPSSVVIVTSWRDDSGKSRIVVHVKKCELDELIESDTISEIRGALPINEANQGMLITNGIVSEDAKKEALGIRSSEMKVFVPPVHLMDIDIILNVLLESRTGVRTKNVEVLLLDHDFFKSIRTI
ncbi:restriction endonuclease [Candidatus Thorarchaeota archaeon]|nr:MAG: restriction endonuclease [Candidatus Thorarchaeota archaeon]